VHGSWSLGRPALLVWTLLGTLKKVEDSLNFVWHVEKPRSFARRTAEYLGMLVVGPLLVVAVIGMTQLALTGRSAELLAQLPLAGQLLRLALNLLPYAVITGLFAFIYGFVPNTRVRWRAALIGGLTAGILWALTGRMFALLVVATARLTIVYAGFAIIVAALLWTYLGWLILLVGVQLSFYLQNQSGRCQLACPGGVRAACAAAHVPVAEAHEAAHRGRMVALLASGCPASPWRGLHALEDAGMFYLRRASAPGRGLMRPHGRVLVARRRVSGRPHAATPPAPIEACAARSAPPVLRPAGRRAAADAGYEVKRRTRRTPDASACKTRGPGA
jgi:uncharacterized BrkB/YihY/UPF0761 family membrane protein